MQEADDETYETFPESLRVVAVTGVGNQREALAFSDHADVDVVGFDTFVRYFRADESDLHGFVPEHWQHDAETLRQTLDVRMEQFLSDIEDLNMALDYNARSTRDRLKRIRGIVERMEETWSGRAATFGKKDLDQPEDMI